MNSFLECQGFVVKLNIIYQDKTIIINLEENVKEILEKQTGHFNIKFFYVTDLVSQNKLKIGYCLTDEMIEDSMNKTPVGGNFKLF